MVSNKRELRSAMIERLTSLKSDQEAKAAKEKQLALHLFKLLQQLSITLETKQLLIGAYHPIKSELNWLSLLSLMQLDLAFPAFISEGEMEFYRAEVSDLELSLEFGTKMLCPKKERRVKPVIPDLLFIPGLAFSLEGARLGRGAGFFDRYLENYHGVKVGICFQEQIQKKIPQDPHDQHMNFVVTDEGIFEVKAK